ncbi:helix-turn-helix domain-containing protein [Cupriavidus basilensis]|uniref:Helix-turn-helix domain-containing protein n=1 Tax=Cupriavidus basilensis TaxID=68895 RepID=A0ABT6ATC6_9BURK|nr:helix-turn-helix domain-containing protein [Cupriavidus basilensis]MDF3834926.1 helix-turn-helix domain-containing protein [Cupriavidus basilensis]
MLDRSEAHWRYFPGPRSLGQAGGSYALCGFEEALPRPIQRLEPASPSIKLIIGFGAAYRVTPLPEASQSHRSFVVGMGGGPVVSEQAPTHSCIEVELPPWAAFRLFDGASDVLSSRLVGLGDIWGSQAALLSEQLHHAPGWAARFRLIEQVLKGRLQSARREAGAEIRWAWGELARHHGNMPISGLRKMIGWSERHLSSRFQCQLGMTPKLAARRLRFSQMRGMLDADAQEGLTDLALACGYADQSHMTREFRAFAGCSPAAYRREHIPDALGKPASLLGGPWSYDAAVAAGWSHFFKTGASLAPETRNLNDKQKG